MSLQRTVPPAATGTDALEALCFRLAGDLDAAFPDLVRTLQDGVYSGARRLVPSAADAEDVTQDTFVRAYRALQAYDAAQIQDLQLRGWIWTIALNLCRNRARSRSRRPTLALADGLESATPGPGPEAMALAGAATDAWALRLERLTGPQRRAVVLRHVAGLSHAEIAQASGRAEGTVRSDVHRGIARLRAMLERESQDES
jgi:RNA polymerase sigma-70 factor (ECF subfamily)